MIRQLAHIILQWFNNTLQYSNFHQIDNEFNSFGLQNIWHMITAKTSLEPELDSYPWKVFTDTINQPAHHGWLRQWRHGHNPDAQYASKILICFFVKLDVTGNMQVAPVVIIAIKEAQLLLAIAGIIACIYSSVLVRTFFFSRLWWRIRTQ